MQHSVRKLQAYEEIHIVSTRYIPCDGVYRFLSAGGNDCYGRTCYRASHVYESSCAVTDVLAQEARLEFAVIMARRKVRAD
jgi:hypothetical protein